MRIFNDVAIPCFLFSFLYANKYKPKTSKCNKKARASAYYKRHIHYFEMLRNRLIINTKTRLNARILQTIFNKFHHISSFANPSFANPTQCKNSELIFLFPFFSSFVSLSFSSSFFPKNQDDNNDSVTKNIISIYDDPDHRFLISNLQITLFSEFPSSASLWVQPDESDVLQKLMPRIALNALLGPDPNDEKPGITGKI